MILKIGENSEKGILKLVNGHSIHQYPFYIKAMSNTGPPCIPVKWVNAS